MPDQPKPIRAMSAGELIAFVRDQLRKSALQKRDFLDASVQFGGVKPTAAELQAICAHEAAADALDTILAIGQDLKHRGRGDPRWTPPEWITKVALALRDAMIAETEADAEREEA